MRAKARNFIIRTPAGTHTWLRRWGLLRKERPYVWDHVGGRHVETWAGEAAAERALIRHIWWRAVTIKNRRRAGRREVPPYRHVGTGDLKGHL